MAPLASSEHRRKIHANVYFLIFTLSAKCIGFRLNIIGLRLGYLIASLLPNYRANLRGYDTNDLALLGETERESSFDARILQSYNSRYNSSRKKEEQEEKEEEEEEERCIQALAYNVIDLDPF